MNGSYVFVEQLTVLAIIGIHLHERVTAQRIQVDLKVSLEQRSAARQDAITDTVDYASLCALATQIAVDGQFQLVETLAEHIADAIAERYQPAWCEITVAKPDAIRAAKTVGVVIARTG